MLGRCTCRFSLPYVDVLVMYYRYVIRCFRVIFFPRTLILLAKECIGFPWFSYLLRRAWCLHKWLYGLVLLVHTCLHVSYVVICKAPLSADVVWICVCALLFCIIIIDTEYRILEINSISFIFLFCWCAQ
jgi:hypothetical protein